MTSANGKLKSSMAESWRSQPCLTNTSLQKKDGGLCGILRTNPTTRNHTDSGFFQPASVPHGVPFCGIGTRSRNILRGVSGQPVAGEAVLPWPVLTTLPTEQFTMTTDTITSQSGPSTLRSESLNGINRRCEVEPPAKPTGQASTIEVGPRPEYSAEFLSQLPQDAGNYNAEDLAEIFAEWQAGNVPAPKAGRSEAFKREKKERTARQVTIWELFSRLSISRAEQRELISSLVGNANLDVHDMTLDQLRQVHAGLLSRLESKAEQAPPSEVPSQEPGAVDQRAESIADRVHDAFEHVAFCSVCTLPMLLEETRARGIDDDDVRDLISDEESNLSFQCGGDRQFRCCRSAKGEFFIERDSGRIGSLLGVQPYTYTT